MLQVVLVIRAESVLKCAFSEVVWLTVHFPAFLFLFLISNICGFFFYQCRFVPLPFLLARLLFPVYFNILLKEFQLLLEKKFEPSVVPDVIEYSF